MAQSPLEAASPTTIGDYLKNWDALSSMIVRGRSFSGRERNCAFLNLGDGKFADVSAASGFDLIDDGRALASCDWDDDGDLDFWITNRTAPRLRLLQNNLSQKRSITLQLEGTNCNRDAIGAVVRIAAGGTQLTRVVRAGDGFMSQSSKRLHFGLGHSNELGPVTASVRWPGGDTEEFSGLEMNGRFNLVQGTGHATAIERSDDSKLGPGAIESAATTEAARIVLTERHTAQPIDYVDFSGKLQRIGPENSAGNPLLINLWASWCAPCVAELADFTQHHEELSAKGLKIVALTTEAVTSDGSKPDVQSAIALAKKSAYPFQIGATDANGLRLLTLLHNQNFVRERPLPLPSSFLMDKHGRLSVIYKGPVSAEQLLADIDLLDAAPSAIEEAAFPFASRNGLELFRIGDLDFAKAYQAGGYIDDARNSARAAIDAASAANNVAARAQAWYFLGTLEQSARNWSDAAAAYRKAIEFAPGQPILKIPLGVVLWQSDARDEADTAFAEAASARPDDPAIMDGIGKANLQIGRPETAIHYFEKALQLSPNEQRHHLSLAIAYEKSSRPAEAVLAYEAILKATPDSADAKNNLAWLLATCREEALRDAGRALALATEINQATSYSNPATLDTLAAAQAESGDFAAAVKTLSEATRLARAAGQSHVVDSLAKKLVIYQSGQSSRNEN